MPRHWGLGAAAGKMLKSFTIVYCASGKRFTAVPETSGERRREHAYPLEELALQYTCCLQQDCAAIWPDDQVMLLCSTVTRSHPSNVFTLNCRDPYMHRIVAWMDKKLLVRRAGLLWELPLGPEQDREVFYHLPISKPLGMVRDKKVAVNLKWNRNLCDFCLKAWSVQAAAICCIIDWCS